MSVTRKMALAVCLFLVTIASAEGNEFSIAEAVGNIRSLDVRNAHKWTNRQKSDFLSNRAKINELLLEEPTGDNLRSWFKGGLYSSRYRVGYGWREDSIGSALLISGQSEDRLEIDIASDVGGFVGAFWNLYPADGQTCVQEKVFYLLSREIITQDDWPLYSALPALSESWRLRIWADTHRRAGLILNRDIDEPAVAASLIRSEIIANALVRGVFDKEVLAQIEIYDPQSGQMYSQEQIDAEFLKIGPDAIEMVEAAFPFFEFLRSQLELSSDAAFQNICGQFYRRR